MICVEIDELVPCLIDCSANKEVKTKISRVDSKNALKKYTKRSGWYTKWVDLLDENEVYALFVDGIDEVQGLVAVRPDADMRTAFVTWMVAAPWNNLEKTTEKRYRGVGGHLFAVAAQRSEEYGYGCAVSGFASNEKLMNHYCEFYKAEAICMLHPYQIFIPEDEGRGIKEVYNYEWTDDVI